MPTQTDLFDDVVRRRIALERYSSTQVRAILRHLIKVEKDLVARIAAMSANGLSTASQNMMLASIRSLYSDSYRQLRVLLAEDFKGLAAAEAEFRNRILKQAQSIGGTQGAAASVQLSAINAAQALAVAEAKPMAGKLLSTWVEDMSKNHVAAIEQAIKISFTEGESLGKMISRVREAGVLNRRGAEAIVRTANTHIASAVSQETYRLNKKVMRGWQFMATLDSRTTMTCADLDGQIFAVGKGPFPPRHIRCRSTDMPVLIGMEAMPRTTYAQWLKRQSKEIQDDILGPSRAKLYRQGKIEVGRFTDSKGKTLTLKQLKKAS